MEIPFLHYDLTELIQTVGYIGLFAIVFAESGLFFGFFFPGDSLLFTAGFLASQGFLDIKILAPLMVVAAIGGDSAGYWMGNKLGRWLMHQKDSFFFKKEHMYQAQEFYDKHGGKTLILARFIPAVRTFVPIVAGMAKMEYTKFIFFNVIGGIIWGAGMSLAGYYLGTLIPGVDKYLLPIVVLIIFLSVLPGLFHMRKSLINKLRRNKAFDLALRFKRFWLG
jgi:membrane-associated protein